MTGHCSNCHKVWLPEEDKGVCQWCGKPAHCQASNRKFRADVPKRSQTKVQRRQLGEGYDQLPDPYLGYFTIAIRFAPKAMLDDREDLLQDIMLALTRVGELLRTRGHQFSEIAQIRTAEHVKDDYWFDHYSYYQGLDCRHCSKEDRAKCRYNWAHSEWAYCDCPKVIRLESLNEPVTDSEGNVTEIGELIADDKALDLEEWLDAKRFLIGAPLRLKAIAIKRNRGQELTHAERQYLSKLRKRYQMSFSEVGG
jgi:hypothetical protein